MNTTDEIPNLLRDTMRTSIKCGEAALARNMARAWAEGNAAGLSMRAVLNPYLPTEPEPEPELQLDIPDD